MNWIGLRFILEHGSFLQVVTTASEAAQLIQDWASGQARLKDRLTFHGTNQFGSWAVKTDSIRGIHTFSLEQAQQQFPQQATLTPSSGWNPALAWGKPS